MRIFITCVPCEHESHVLAVINERSPISATCKTDKTDYFDSNEPYSCPFCNMKLPKGQIPKAYFDYLEKERISFSINGNIVEFEKEDVRLILKLEELLSQDSFEKLNEHSFFKSKNEFELIRLFMTDIDIYQWRIKTENVKKSVSHLVCY